MSANNILKIWNRGDVYVLDECDAEEGKLIVRVGTFFFLRKAVKEAKKYMKYNEIEYGLDIQI